MNTLASYLIDITESELQGVLGDLDRLAAIDRTHVLEHRDDAALQRLARLASVLLDTEVGVLSIITDERHVFAYSRGLPDELERSREIPLTHSFCKYCVATGSALVVEDAREHPQLRMSPAIEELDVISYAGMPLRLGTGEVIGTLSGIDGARHRWSDQQISGLAELAEAAVCEIELRAAGYELARRHEQQGNLLITITHELRTPLTSVVGFSSTLEQMWSTLDEATKLEFLGIVRREGGRLQQLVDDLLLNLQLDAHSFELTTSEFALLPVVEEVLRDIGLDIGADVSISPGLAVAADRFRVQQMLANFVSNAVKYGDPPLEVRAITHRGFVDVCVIDRGSGVPAEFESMLFRKFARSRSARESSAVGSGLGLSIVRGLARVHGGDAWYEPAAGGGSCFAFSVPVATCSGS